MSAELNEFTKSSGMNSQPIVKTLADKVFAAAQPQAVYGEPVTAGSYTVITAAEVSSAGGGGGGGGFGGGLEPASPQTSTPGQAGEARPSEANGGGSGVGLGGAAFARPVAIVAIGPNGVEVKPVFDVTKIGLGLITMLGAMLMMLRQMRRTS